ncbi:hypothetical protein QVD17_26387 [Tagetes erecta]|uniref:Uncharacterized protein n=1 Tax=Tagetes erecta TaxID=13708 RepID=A0AAD8K6T0_TARER|nr:hypothetical protein QVD17_26387 [Tagetes erecta]
MLCKLSSGFTLSSFLAIYDLEPALKTVTYNWWSGCKRVNPIHELIGTTWHEDKDLISKIGSLVHSPTCFFPQIISYHSSRVFQGF